MIKCVICGVEPKMKKKMLREGMYTLIRCPKCGFSTGGFQRERIELEHWNKLNERRPHQIQMQIADMV